MKLIISRILMFLLSIKSIISINFFIVLKKFFNKNLNVVFFYFPVKIYQDNILELIDELKKEKNVKIVLGYNRGSSSEIKKYKDAFFLNIGYLKFIKNINIFLSSYLVYDFPDSLNKVYLHHDIYDGPWVNPEKEKFLIKTLNKSSHIFLSSDISISALQKKINQYSAIDRRERKLKLINTGYLKLDHIHQKLKDNVFKEDSILLAPTLTSTLIDYNLDNYLNLIIQELLNDSKFKLIYRPHPGDVKDSKKNLIIKSICEKYKDNKNFTLDVNISYLDSYKKSKILITDFSGTAYTYAFSKLRPVIFFSKNENKLTRSDLNDLFYFNDRNNIGTIVQNVEKLKDEVTSINKQIDFFSNKIELLRSKRIKYFNNSMQQTLLNIINIINDKN